MPRKPRYKVADPAEVQVFHAVQLVWLRQGAMWRWRSVG